MDLDPDTLRRIYEQKIAPDLFGPFDPAPGRPVVLLLGGQPGAGKTAAQQWMIHEHADHDVVAVIGDDFRRFHPNYQQVLDADPLQMPHLTAPAAGAWTGMAVDQALRDGYSLLIEGTWRTRTVVEDTINQASGRGYRVHAGVVATPPVLSLLGTLDRYYQASARHVPARWTPVEAHSQTVAALPDTVRAIAGNPHLERFSVLTRDGATPFDQHAPIDPARALASYLTQFHRPIDSDELDTITIQAAGLYAHHQAITSDQPAAQQAWAALTEHLAAPHHEPTTSLIERLHHLHPATPTRTSTDPHRTQQLPHTPDIDPPTR